MLSDGLIDLVAMDLKAPLARYREVIGVLFSRDAVRRSIDAILEAGVDHEFRTTCVKPLLTRADLLEMGPDIKSAGSTYCSPFNRRVLDAGFGDIAAPYRIEELLAEARQIVQVTATDCLMRTPAKKGRTTKQ